MIVLITVSIVCLTSIVLASLALAGRIVPRLVAHEASEAPTPVPALEPIKKPPWLLIVGSDSGVEVTSYNGDKWWSAMGDDPWYYQGSSREVKSANKREWIKLLASRQTTLFRVWSKNQTVEFSEPPEQDA